MTVWLRTSKNLSQTGIGYGKGPFDGKSSDPMGDFLFRQQPIMGGLGSKRTHMLRTVSGDVQRMG